MKLVQVAEQNKKYYTKEFIYSFNIGAKTQYEADKKEAERTVEQGWRNNMTVHDLSEYGEYVLRNDREYQAEIERLKSEIDKLVYRQRMVMASAIIRLAMAMVTEQSNSKCADCTGGYCEDCLEGKANDEE